MKKRKEKVALYDPYLDVLGGGEKHILSILKVLEEEGFEISIFWDRDIRRDIEQRLRLTFKPSLTFVPSIFDKKTSLFNKLAKLHSFAMFFYVTDGSYFFSSAKKNYVFCMVPKQDLYRINLLNRIKAVNYSFIANSDFTKNRLMKWGVHAETIYPYIDKEFIDLKIQTLKKDKIILSVGRFFKHLHSKRQDVIIKLFKKIKQNNTTLKDFTLILAGGLKEKDTAYFHELTSLVGDDSSIILLPNVPYDELFSLYKKSLFYWHFAGYGIDEYQHPELVEHFGIAPLEAMASGCITFCYRAGGPKEMVKDGVTGFLFSTDDELIIKMNTVMHNASLQEKIQHQAKKYVGAHFSYPVFKQKVREALSL